MGHLDWCQYINADRVSVFLIFLNILILQLDNAPDASADVLYTKSEVIRKGKVHKHGVAENF